jgi:hypothetical protein
MTVEQLTEDDVRGLLVAVGAPSTTGPGDYGRTFDDLGLDSLARIEIASRIKDRYGVDVEEHLEADETPIGMARLVNVRLATAERKPS